MLLRSPPVTPFPYTPLFRSESTTLGREGSDYTAAVFANLLFAESQTIWKDVQGVMNADPKIFSDAVFISELNYDERSEEHKSELQSLRHLVCRLLLEINNNI